MLEEQEVIVSLPQQRLEEIEFYNYIKRLLIKYNRSVTVFDLVEVFASFGNVVPVLIKKLIQQVYIEDKSFVPSKEEQLILYKKQGLSMREIKDKTGIHPNTQYRILERLQQDSSQRPSLAPRLDKESYMSIHAFMEQIRKFKEI